MKNLTIAVLALLVSLPSAAQSETATTDAATVGTVVATGTSTPATAPRQHSGQTPTVLLRYGCISYDAVLRAMPEYAEAQKSIENLRGKYDAEMKRSEDEFNVKYEEFLESQRDLVPSILRKRQGELQEMMDKNTAFRAEARRLLSQAEADALAPVRSKLNAVIGEVAAEQGLAFVLNTDGNACPYVNPAMGVDVTELVKARTGK